MCSDGGFFLFYAEAFRDNNTKKSSRKKITPPFLPMLPRKKPKRKLRLKPLRKLKKLLPIPKKLPLRSSPPRTMKKPTPARRTSTSLRLMRKLRKTFLLTTLPKTLRPRPLNLQKQTKKLPMIQKNS